VVGHDFSWVRQTDHEFLVSGRAREVVEEEGITVIGWSTLLEQWQHPPGQRPPDDHWKSAAVHPAHAVGVMTSTGPAGRAAA
jgi:hypothetical protein